MELPPSIRILLNKTSAKIILARKFFTFFLFHNTSKVGDPGAQAFRYNSTLTSLNLEGTGISDLGAQTLAQNTTLTHLNLGGNKIGILGVQDLAKNTILRSLNLHHNNFENAEIRTLVDKIWRFSFPRETSASSNCWFSILQTGFRVYQPQSYPCDEQRLKIFKNCDAQVLAKSILTFYYSDDIHTEEGHCNICVFNPPYPFLHQMQAISIPHHHQAIHRLAEIVQKLSWNYDNQLQNIKARVLKRSNNNIINVEGAVEQMLNSGYFPHCRAPG